MSTPKRVVDLVEIPEEEQPTLSAFDAELFLFKDLNHHMELPFFSLSKKPNTEIYTKTFNDGRKLEIIPSALGRATIYDKDVLVYIISSLLQLAHDGVNITRRVKLDTSMLLKDIKRGTGGKDYLKFMESLDRLKGTSVKTNAIIGADKSKIHSYSMIDEYEAIRSNGDEGKLVSLEVTLSEPIFNAILRKKAILTVNPQYFTLRKPLEKKIYEIGRKHIGNKKEFSLSIKLLKEKAGSESALTELRRTIKTLMKNHNDKDTFPDFIIGYDKEKDQIIYKQKGLWWDKPCKENNFQFPKFDTSTYEVAKEIVPDVCIYFLEEEFKKWVLKKPENFKMDKKSLQRAYLNFCKTKQKQKIAKDAGQSELF